MIGFAIGAVVGALAAFPLTLGGVDSRQEAKEILTNKYPATAVLFMFVGGLIGACINGGS